MICDIARENRERIETFERCRRQGLGSAAGGVAVDRSTTRNIEKTDFEIEMTLFPRHETSLRVIDPFARADESERADVGSKTVSDKNATAANSGDREEGEDEEEETFYCDGCDGSSLNPRRKSDHVIVGPRYNKIGDDYDICSLKFRDIEDPSERRLYRKIECPPARMAPRRRRRAGVFPTKQVIMRVQKKRWAKPASFTLECPVLAPVDYVPKATSWVSLKRNVSADDQPVLRYIPYFGENDKNNLDVSFYDAVPSELGEDCAISSEVDESIALVASRYFSEHSRRVHEWMTSGRGFSVEDLEKRVEDRLEMRERWRHEYPSKYGVMEFEATPSQWKKDVLELEKFTTNVSFASHVGFSLAVPSMLHQDPTKRRAASKDCCKADNERSGDSLRRIFVQSSESFRALFCRRCFTFDCHVHGAQQPFPVVSGNPRKRTTRPLSSLPEKHPLRSMEDWSFKKDASIPCGDGCYKQLTATAGCCTSPITTDVWSDFEDALLVKSASVHTGIAVDDHRGLICLVAAIENDAVCAISSCFKKFSCRDVRQRLRTLVKTFDLTGVTLVESTRDRKRRRSTYTKSELVKNTLNKIKRVVMRDGYNTKLFQPCQHPGEPCTKANCSCIQRGVFCEKYCGGCARDCPNAFPGCKCRHGQCRTDKCVCFAAGRGCDPDKCLYCEAHLHPDEVVARGVKRRCANSNLAYGLHGSIGVAASKIHGWGVFARQRFKKGDFVYQYVGELLSQNEADRRGKIYDKLNLSFLFNLNEHLVIDATRKGSKIKFANHSDTPNCVPMIKMSGGDHHIAIFAKRDIEIGEEIKFNYSYNEEHSKVHFSKQ
eukprot:g3196.t1